MAKQYQFPYMWLCEVKGMGIMHKGSNVIFVIVVASRVLAEGLDVEASRVVNVEHGVKTNLWRLNYPKKPKEDNHNLFIL